MSAETPVIQHRSLPVWIRVSHPTLLGTSLMGTLLAVLLWLSSLNDIMFAQMNDLGLVSVLPISFLAALAVLTVAFTVSLASKPFLVPLASLNIFVLIMIIFGTPAILGEAPRFAVTWRHVGIIDLIQRTGEIDPTIDAYFNWPGFFVLGAFLSDALNLGNTVAFGTWASVFFNVLYLGPLLMITRSFTSNRRVQWLSVWFFYSANWIGQDYLSPQALNYFFYLVIIAILLKWFRIPSAPLPFRIRTEGRLLFPVRLLKKWLVLPEASSAMSTPGQRGGFALVIILLFGVVVASHQLTPFAILLAVSTLVVFNRVTLRGLPALMTVIIVLWIVYVATEYMNGHFKNLVTSLGQFGSSVDANVSERLAGSEDHQLVTQLRLVMTLGLWSLAGLGFIRRFWQGRGDAPLVLLAGAPFALLGMQNYGGEVLLRIYLFNLPFVALLAASVFFSKRKTRIPWSMLLPLIAVSFAILAGLLTTRYGNERMDYKTEHEIEGMRSVYEIAPEGSLLLSVNTSVAWKFEDYETYTYKIGSTELDTLTVDGLVELMQDARYDNAFLVVTRSQGAYMELFMGMTPAERVQFEQDLAASPALRQIYSNPDVTVFTRADAVLADPLPHAEPYPLGELSLRQIILLACLILAPGLAITLLLDLRDFWSMLALTVASGVAVIAAVANIAIYTHVWSPTWIVFIIVLLSGVGLVVKIKQVRQNAARLAH